MPNPPDEFFTTTKQVTLPNYVRDSAGKVVKLGVTLTLSILNPPDPDPPVQSGAILLETGDHLLTEAGFNLLLG